MIKETIMLRALKVICKAMAVERDGPDVSVDMGMGWLEEMKYNLVDRVIENVEPGFDGGETTDEETEKAVSDYEQLVDKYLAEIDIKIKEKIEAKKKAHQ